MKYDIPIHTYAGPGLMYHGETPVDDTFSFEELQRRCLGNLELVERILATFKDGFEDELLALQSAVGQASSTDVARLAHRMKGSCSNVAARGLGDCVARIEEMARSGQIQGVAELLELLTEEWKRFHKATSVDVPTNSYSSN